MSITLTVPTPGRRARLIAAGIGVGLFMSKNIIEKNMGGRLSARNVNGGAEFVRRAGFALILAGVLVLGWQGQTLFGGWWPTLGARESSWERDARCRPPRRW